MTVDDNKCGNRQRSKGNRDPCDGDQDGNVPMSDLGGGARYVSDQVRDPVPIGVVDVSVSDLDHGWSLHRSFRCLSRIARKTSRA
jgi:hypothetical protein